MSGLHFMGEVPFTHIYLHGTVRDTQHRKMSKSLGNGIDPLEVVERYGADALRYTLVAGMSVGTDVILDPDDLETSFAPGRNFANKLWNAGRFILSNLDGPPRPLAGPRRDAVRRDELTLADRWIIARCDATVREATEAYEKFPPERGRRARSTASSGATWPTGTSSRSSPGSMATCPAATWPGPWRRRRSTWRSGCSIR